MTTPFHRLQPVLAFAARHLDEDISLAALAAQTKLSAFHLHRVFSAVAGETPKQFTLRLRLNRAAAMLLSTEDSVLDIAIECGFQSHEAFCRAFRKRFQMTPGGYRRRGFANENGPPAAQVHSAVVRSAGPCIQLFHVHQQCKWEKGDMMLSITKKEIPPQGVIFVRRRIKPSELAATLGEVFGKVFQYAQQHGFGLAGPPMARYIEMGPGMWTIEAGMPVAGTGGATGENSEVQAGTLPGGWVATATHTGPYDQLHDAHAAVQQWLEAEGLTPSGGPWESYVTDPADYPDPKDWKTEIFWPVKNSKK